MSENDKAAPGVSSTENGNGQMFFEDFTPVSDSITDFRPAQGSIAFLLLQGRSNALTCRELQRITGLEERSITRAINRERIQGAPILSDTVHGFWLAADAAELNSCLRSLRRRAREIYKTAEAIERRWSLEQS